MKKPKVVAALPAFNAAQTLKTVIQSLPKGVFSAVIVSDDCSTDGTRAIAKEIAGIRVVQTPRNLGYGGNLKYCLSTALAMGADIVVEIHPDGEYLTDGVISALEEIKRGALLVLGNRFLHRPKGMYWWKILGTKALTAIDNLLLGTNVSDLHQGFRVYSRELLTAIDFRGNHNDYLFSFEIIAQAVFGGFRIESVPVSTRYTGNKRGARTGAAFRYALGTFWVIIRFWMAKLGLTDNLFRQNDDRELPKCSTCRNIHLVHKILGGNQWSVFLCDGCGNGFTHPKPEDIHRWYRQNYYDVHGVVGTLKKIAYSFFQRRRMDWVKQHLRGGVIVDVGSGEGEFGKNLGKKFNIFDIETLFAVVSNLSVIKTDFLTWKPPKKVDAIVFWESLEHVADPASYLAHAASMLKPSGFLYIEYPRFDSLESRLFGSRWYHLDLPRHLSHLTDAGVQCLVERAGIEVIEQRPVFAPEYAVIGFAASVLGVTADELALKALNPLFFLAFAPIVGVACLVEAVLFLLGESPVGLVVARKS